MIIITQNRDMILGYEKEDILYSIPIIRDGIFWGVNLMLHDVSIGTFYNVKEVIDEMTNIINYEDEYYCVTIYED